MNRALKTTLLPLVALGFLLAGCGERHEARSLAQDFMEEHMPMQDYEVVRWSRLDSTFFVTPVALKAMHAEAERSKICPLVTGKPEANMPSKECIPSPSPNPPKFFSTIKRFSMRKAGPFLKPGMNSGNFAKRSNPHSCLYHP